MKNLKWWQKTAVYQIYPKSFMDTTGKGAGDLVGVTKKLDYLQKLGIGAIWLTPIYPSPMIDNGYDIANYTEIDPNYGTMSDFENLISEADKRNIKIVMDLVYNHSSDKNSWFIESKSSKNNPKAEWYIWRDAKPDGSAPTNWRAVFGGSAWTWCESRQQYYLHTFAEQQPDLNWENPEVRRALFDAANFWLKKGVGGFRIDAITYIKKPAKFLDGKPDGKDGMVAIHSMTANTPGILDFLHEFKREVFDGHDIFTVGEANGVSADELKNWVGENGVFDMLFEFSHMNLPFTNGEIWCYPREWKLTELKKALSDSQQATKETGWCPIFFENHDQPRCINHFFPKNSDPIKAAKAMATILLTLRGTPFIFQGQELGFTNTAWNSIDEYNDISSHGQYNFALKEGFSKEKAMEFVHFFSRDNARTPMQWTAGKNSGFTAGKSWLPIHDDYKICNAEVEDGDKNSVLNYFRELNNLREKNEILLCGDYEEIFHGDENIFAFVRTFENKKIYTLVNFSLNKISFDAEFLKSAKKIFGNYETDEKGILQPSEAVVYEEVGK